MSRINLKRFDVVEIANVPHQNVFVIRHVIPETVSFYTMASIDGKMYGASLPSSMIKVIRRASIKTNQISFSFMKDEDRKLDLYIEERISKEKAKLNRLNNHNQPPQFRKPKLTSTQIANVAIELEKKGESKEAIRKVIDKLIGG